MKRVAAICAMSAFALTACAEAEPDRGMDYTSDRAMVISLETDNTLQLLLGEIYAGALGSEGRRVVINQAVADNMPLYERQGDLFITCAADELQALAPEEANKLRSTFSSDEELASEAAQREAIYAAYMGTLGEALDGADPAAGAHCPAADTEILPNHIVAVFQVSMFNRTERLLLNQVTGALKDDELKDWVQQIDSGQTASAAAAEFLEQYGFTQGMQEADSSDTP